MAKVALFDTLRTLANGSISASYAAVGAPITHAIRLICFTNNTDGDMFFTYDKTVDQIFVAKGAFKLFDIMTNKDDFEGYLALRQGTQFYVRQSTAPTTGSVYIEVIYGE